MIKLLIVEDEAGIRESLAQNYSWSDLGCELTGCAAGGIEAMEFCLKTPPDIIISDIVMPGIDGLAFLRYIKGRNPSTHFIMLTGHREFDYARDALNLGADYFLLKPIDYEELKQAVEKTVASILSADNERAQENQFQHVVRSLLNGRIFSRNTLTSTVQKQLSALRMFRIIILAFDDQTEDTFRTQGLADFCINLLEPGSIIVVRSDDRHVVLIYQETPGSENIGAFKDFLAQIQLQVYCSFKQSLSIGVSLRQNGPNSLRGGYLEALRALGQRFFNGNSAICFFSLEEEIDTASELYAIHPIPEAGAQLYELMAEAEPDLIANDVNAWLSDTLSTFHHHSDAVKSTAVILVDGIARRVYKSDQKLLKQFYIKWKNFSPLLRAETLADLEGIFLHIVMDLYEYLSVHSKPRELLMSKIATYIENHCTENLSLNDISKKFYLSSSYLSSLIASEMGENFVDILNKARIRKACFLLQDPSLKIAEIAHRVGYREPQYFSISFKKYMDLTPRDYREQEKVRENTI